MTGNDSGAEPPQEAKALSLRIPPEGRDPIIRETEVGCSDMQCDYQQYDYLRLVSAKCRK